MVPIVRIFIKSTRNLFHYHFYLHVNDREIESGTSMWRKLRQSAIVDGFGNSSVCCLLSSKFAMSAMRTSTEITVEICTDKRVPAQPGKLSQPRLFFQEYQWYSQNNTVYRERVPLVLLKNKGKWFNADVDKPISLIFP